MLCLLRQPRSFLFFWSTVLAFLSVPVVFKAVFHRQRPYTGGRHFDSFPSGHVAIATVLAGALLVVLLPRCRSAAQRVGLAAAAAAWPAVMAAARMILGCHFPADVVGGMLLGSAWLSGCLGAWVALYGLARGTPARGLAGRCSG